MSDPTPTTERVRSKFATVLGSKSGWRHSSEWGRDFDRWLAAHDAGVAAKALRDAADGFSDPDDPCHDPEPLSEVAQWLRLMAAERADRIGASDE